MRKIKAHSFLLALILLLVSCVNHSTQSWAYFFVTWDSEVYRVTDEIVTDIEKEIGKIRVSSTVERDKLPNLYSNFYKKGTKLFKISNTDTKDAIAVLDDGTYYKAERVENK